MHKHQKLFSGAAKSLPLTGRADGEAVGRGENTDTKVPTASLLVRPLTGAADEEGVSAPQSVGFWKASLTVLANNFKLAGLACLSLAAIVTLTISWIGTNYGATPALAAGFTATGPATIGISTSGNVDLGSITSRGGTKIASHTLTIKTNAVKGYTVTLSSNSEQTGLVNTDGNGSSGSGNSNNSNSSSNNSGSSSTTTTIPTITTNGTLANNTWGYSIDGGSDGSATTYRPIKPKSTMPADIIASSTNPTSDTGNVKTITYGVRVDNPNTLKAGAYTAQVVYTATANLPAEPIITKVEPSTINTGNTADSDRQITITGTNLESTYEVYIDLNKDNQRAEDGSEDCTSPTVTDTTITCTAPASSVASTYKLHVLTQGGEATYDIKYQTATLQAIGTMQDPNISKICQSTTTPNASATQIDSTGAHTGDPNWVPEKTMTDIRDNKTYKVRKLADGNCWMVENLALGTTNSAGVKLTNQDTDLHSQTSFTLPAFSSAGNSWSYYDNTPYIIQGSTVNGGSSWTASMGNWYTWGAATADTAKNVTNSGRATDSICPKGWQLPDNTGAKSYYNLITTIYKQSTGSTISQAPLSFAYAGYYLHTDKNGSTRDVSNGGYYWSSTAYANDRAYYLYIRSDYANLQSFNDRNNGLSVRCAVQ